MKWAIVAFVRNPHTIQGPSKLTEELPSAERACLLYNSLVAITRRILVDTKLITRDVDCFFAVEGGEFSEIRNPMIGILNQTEGTIGDRKYAIQQQLKSYTGIIYIISDMPQLTSQTLRDTIEKMEAGKEVLGGTSDGHIYLLGIKHQADQAQWNLVRHETTQAFQDAKEKFMPQSEVLPPLSSIDDLVSLRQAYQQLKSFESRTKEHENFLELCDLLSPQEQTAPDAVV